MCTIIVALGVWPDSPLVVAANRDEMLARPAEPPRLRRAGEMAEIAIFAPRDQVAGGTWLGLAGGEFVVALTNRRQGALDGRRRSRGEVVTLALGAGTRERACERIRSLPASEFNPFHLVLADRHGAAVLWTEGDDYREVSLEPGIHWVTERGFEAGSLSQTVGPSLRHRTLSTLSLRLAAKVRPDVAQWQRLLGDHEPHARSGERVDPHIVGLDAICVHAPSLGYGTRSSTLIRLGPTPDALEFHHAGGPPCEHPFEDLSAGARLLLPSSGAMLPTQ